MSAPIKNQNAVKPADQRVAFPVMIRGTEDERKTWRRAASGQKWNEWARNVLNQASK